MSIRRHKLGGSKTSASWPVPAERSESPNFGAMRTFLPFFRRHWRGFVLPILAVLVTSLLGLLKPWPLKFLIDDVLDVGRPGQGAGTGGQTIDTTPDISLPLIAAIAGAILGLAVAQGLFNYIKEFFLSATSQRIAFGIRRNLFEHAQRLSLAFHDRQRTGDMLTRMTSDVGKLQEFVGDKLLVATLTGVVQFFGMLAVMLVIDWRLGLVAAAWAPLAILASMYFRRRIREQSQQARVREGDMSSLAQETMSSIRVVKAFGRERDTVERFEEQTGEMLKANVSVARLEARLGWAMSVLTAAGLASVIFYGAYRVAAGALTVGTLVVFIQYIRDLQEPINLFARLWAMLAKVVVRAERIAEVLTERPAVVESPDARAAHRFRGEVRFENVSFGYVPGQLVLDRVEFAIDPGQTIAVVGPTGAGKSTVASLLLRLYDPVEGRVLIDGRDVRDYKLGSLIEQVAVVLQESLLFQTTIRDNIAFGKPKASTAEIEEAARLAYCDEFLEHLPEGLETVVGERGTTLSGGQRQRIAIARALIRNAPILVLDEPTTGLDAEAEEIVMRALDRLARGRTTLVIAHKLATVRRADRIYVIVDGRIAENGTHEELLARGGWYAHAFRSQAADTATPSADGGRERMLGELDEAAPIGEPAAAEQADERVSSEYASLAEQTAAGGYAALGSRASHLTRPSTHTEGASQMDERFWTASIDRGAAAAGDGGQSGERETDVGSDPAARQTESVRRAPAVLHSGPEREVREELRETDRVVRRRAAKLFTPDEIRRVQIRRGFFGYRTDSVDRAIGEIAANFESLWQQRADLVDRIEQVEKEIEKHEELEALLRSTLASGETAADEMKDQARREADVILSDTYAEARSALREATAERERLLSVSARVHALLHAELGALSEQPADTQAGEPSARKEDATALKVAAGEPSASETGDTSLRKLAG